MSEMEVNLIVVITGCVILYKMFLPATPGLGKSWSFHFQDQMKFHHFAKRAAAMPARGLAYKVIILQHCYETFHVIMKKYYLCVQMIPTIYNSLYASNYWPLNKKHCLKLEVQNFHSCCLKAGCYYYIYFVLICSFKVSCPGTENGRVAWHWAVFTFGGHHSDRHENVIQYELLW